MSEQQPPSAEGQISNGVGWLTLRNPQRKNAITLTMAATMSEFCARLEEDASVGAAVIRGEGGYFCSGADTRDLAASSENPASVESVARISALYQSFVRFGELPIPTIAFVEGGAVGAGLNLALAADLMVVTPETELQSGFLARGIHPGGGHFSLLGKAGGWSRAVAMGVLGQPLRGQEIVDAGLAFTCVKANEADGLLKKLTGPAALDPVLTRRAMNSAKLQLGPQALPWAASLEVERGAQMWSMARKGQNGWTGQRRRETVA